MDLHSIISLRRIRDLLQTSRKSEDAQSSKISSPSFESMLESTSVIKNIQESLNKLTQHLISSSTPSSHSSGDTSRRQLRSQCPSPSRYRSPKKKLAKNRPSRSSRRSSHSRSFIKTWTPDRHSVSPSYSTSSTSKHRPFDVEDPSNF